LGESLSPDQVTRLREAAQDSSPVSGYTHSFYKYPARFSPVLARAVIREFTRPGDLVLDPFVGGGTTLVEAISLGRSAIGVDISSLAAFVSEVKTTLYSDQELRVLAAWAERARDAINVHRSTVYFGDYAERGYYKCLESAATWRLRKSIEQALASAMRLGNDRLERFARCAILRTAQWALDARKRLPSVQEFRDRLAVTAMTMIVGARELARAVRRTGRAPIVRCLNRSADGLEEESVFDEMPAPRLVLTSPPYPGIHMLYHRWQVDGRKETAAPFWIADRLDGSFSSYYTMGDRKAPGLPVYFDSIRRSLGSIAAICDGDTTVVQVVAFSEPSWQLPRYLEVAEDAGFREVRGETGRRIRRRVPNRRWHADQMGETYSSKEVVLVHRLSPEIKRSLRAPPTRLSPTGPRRRERSAPA
jgi:hypothetical protein